MNKDNALKFLKSAVETAEFLTGRAAQCSNTTVAIPSITLKQMAACKAIEKSRRAYSFVLRRDTGDWFTVFVESKDIQSFGDEITVRIT